VLDPIFIAIILIGIIPTLVMVIYYYLKEKRINLEQVEQ